MITTTTMNLNASDIPFLVELEQLCFSELPWTEREFVKAINSGSSFCLKAEGTNKIIGYIFYYKDDEGGLEITNLAIHPEYQRLGLGTKMVNILLKNKLFKEIYFSVPEFLLSAQLFFKKLGFKAVKILPNVYETGHDAYFFTNDSQAQFEYTYNKDRNKLKAA